MFKKYLVEKIVTYWYKQGAEFSLPWTMLFFCFLLPLSKIYKLVISLRRLFFELKLLPVHNFNVPIIVVGNITVGGTGKTPVVIYLVELLRKHGFNPGVVSRGYGVSDGGEPKAVAANSDPAVVGDEPVLIAKRTGCPLVVDRKRARAVEYLLARNKVDIVICDDGLQHYALARDIEIAVIDGMRKFGNGYCLPAGPLREPISRLAAVDFTLLNTKESTDENGEESFIGTSWIGDAAYFSIYLVPSLLYNLNNPAQTCALGDFAGKLTHAVAGIGNPQKFFVALEAAGVRIMPHEFPDHHQFSADDLAYVDSHPIIMTEKDAVKCKNFVVNKNCWVLPVRVKIAEEFEQELLVAINKSTEEI